MNKKQTLTAIQIALLGIILGLRIAISFLPAINIGNYVEMGVSFIGAALSGILFGPWYAMIMDIANDIITAQLKGYEFFFGYTLSAALAGIIYGYGFWRKEITLKRVFIVVLIITVVVNLGLGSLWVRMMRGEAWSVFMGLRIAKNAVSLFLNTGVLMLIFKNPIIKRYIQRYQF